MPETRQSQPTPKPWYAHEDSIRSMSPRFAAPALMLALTSAAFADGPNLASLRKSLEEARKRAGVQGMSVVVVKDGKIVFMDGFGYRDVAKKLPATPTTAYAIGSSTKAFTALLTTQAAVDGKLALTDHPQKYLPTFKLKDPDTNAKITLSDMMSHRSGLPRTDLAWYTNGFSRDELLQIVAGVDPTAKLGEKWQYQNLMFLFTGMIDEKVYGKSYETLLQERYFDPLGMNRTTSTYTAFMATPERAIGYTPGGKALPVHNIDVCAPAGSISSTVVDMSNYIKMLLADGQYEGKQLFSKDAIAETRKRRMAMAPGTPLGYGFGWMLRPFENRTLVEHGGNIDGFNAEVALLPDDHIGAVVLTNVSSSPLALEAAQMAMKEFLPPAKAAATNATAAPKAATPAYKPVPADEAPVERLGRYRLEVAKIDLRFYREGKKTMVEQDGQSIPLALIGPGHYKAVGVPGEPGFIFQADPADSKKTVATIEVSGAKLSLKAIEPYKSPITGEALLAKMVEAEGGADVLRSHRTAVVRFRSHMTSDGIDVVGMRYRTPGKVAMFQAFFGLGRQFATEQSFCDGERAGEMASFALPSIVTGAQAADAIRGTNDLADLTPWKTYRSLDVIGEDKIGDEPVYILKKMPLEGTPVTEFVSKKTYLTLRIQRGTGATLATEDYSDFRNVDGLMVPFRGVTSPLEGGKTITEITSVHFGERVPDWLFRFPEAK